MKDECTVKSFGVQKLAEFNRIEWNALEFDQQRTKVHAKQNHIFLGLKLNTFFLTKKMHDFNLEYIIPNQSSLKRMLDLVFVKEA